MTATIDETAPAISQPAQLTLNLPDSVSLTGITLPPGLHFNEWAEMFKDALFVVRGSRWWIGDLLVYGEENYGELYASVVEAGIYTRRTLAKHIALAKAYPLDERWEELSLSHHEVVMDRHPKLRYTWLGLAVSNNWTVLELTEYVKGQDEPEGDDEQPRQGSLGISGNSLTGAALALRNFVEDWMTSETGKDEYDRQRRAWPVLWDHIDDVFVALESVEE